MLIVPAMPTLRDSIQEILARASDEIVAAVIAQLGGGSEPAPRAKAAPSSKRTRRSSEDIKRDAEKLAKICGDEGMKRGEIQKRTGFTDSQYLGAMAYAKAHKLVRQKGEKNAAVYLSA